MSAKKVVIVMGSPRKNGNSATLAQSVAEGARAAGADVESFYLHEMDIKPCTACDVCREDTATDCNINDELFATRASLAFVKHMERKIQ